MSLFYLIRHGTTQWNIKEVFRGQKDIELNEDGLKEAEATGLCLKNTPIQVIFSSPLKRAKKTADIIASYCKVPVEILDDITDINFGKWQGMSHEDVKNCFPELYKKWKQSPHTVTFPEGEGLQRVKDRAAHAIERIIASKKLHTFAIVSHRVVCKVLTCYFLGLDLSRFWYIRHDTCAISVFQSTQDGYLVLKLNDSCHLNNILQRPKTDF